MKSPRPFLIGKKRQFSGNCSKSPEKAEPITRIWGTLLYFCTAKGIPLVYTRRYKVHHYIEVPHIDGCNGSNQGRHLKAGYSKVY